MSRDDIPDAIGSVDNIPDGMVIDQSGALVGRETVDESDIAVDPRDQADESDDELETTTVDEIDDRMDQLTAAEPVAETDVDPVETDDPDIDDDRRSDDPDIDGPDIDLVAPQTHEVGAKLLFDDDGMSPYHAFASGDRDGETPVDRILDAKSSDDPILQDVAGDDWIVPDDASIYWDGAIAAPGEDYDRYREYQIKLVAEDQLVEDEQRKIVYQIRPALPDATHYETGESIGSLPDDLPHGVRIQVKATYVDPDQFIPILQEVADAIGIRPSYFSGDPHDWSRIYQYARYMRVDRQLSEDRIVGPGGIIYRLADFGRERRSKGVLKWDNEDIMGHYQSIELDAETWSQLIPGVRRPARLKSYHMANPERSTSDAPTTHPKVEVQYAGDESISWDDRDQLATELSELILNALKWSGFNVERESAGFIPDAYFDPAETDDPYLDEVQLYDDPIDDYREVQRDIATSRLIDADLSDSQRDVAEVLSDGGSMDYRELADRSDTSVSTVYRAIAKLEDVVRTVNGRVEWVDDVVRDRIGSIFETLDAAADRVGSRVEDLLSDRRDDDVSGGPYQDWIDAYGADIQLDGDRVEIDISIGTWTEGEIKRILRSGAVAAAETSTGLLHRLRRARVRYYDQDGERRESRALVRHGTALKAGGYRVR